MADQSPHRQGQGEQAVTTLQEMLARRQRSDANRGTPTFPPRPKQHFGSSTICDDAAVPTRIRLIIFTYERPKMLKRLLADVQEHRGAHEISVVVYDDASSSGYDEVQKKLGVLGGTYVRARKKHGKQQFWKWVSRAYSDQRTRDEPLFCLLPDDFRLCTRFFDRAINIWNRITDPYKVALNPIRDDSREGVECWTKQRPIDCGPVFDAGWVDGALLCNRRYFEALNWKIHPVDSIRWRRNPKSSSGVGEQISVRLALARLGMYKVKRSLCVHVAVPSKMNPVERQRHPLRALHFIDGEAAHQRLAGASRPRRPRPGTAPMSSSTRLSHLGGVRKIR